MLSGSGHSPYEFFTLEAQLGSGGVVVVVGSESRHFHLSSKNNYIQEFAKWLKVIAQALSSWIAS